MTLTCTRCRSPARWRDGEGRHFCGSHVPANGKPLARLPEPDITDELEEMALRSDLEYAPDDSEKFRKAAAEIRRLRAESDKSGSC